MRRWLLWLPLAAFVLVLAVVGSGLFRPADRTVRSALVGKPLPAFALAPMLPSKPGLASTEFRGAPRLLNVFASWCIPCAAETPQLMRLKQAGARIDAVAIRDQPGDVRAFLGRYGDPYERIGSDPEGAVQLAIGSSGVPETFVIGADGRIAYQHVGDIREDDVAVLLAALEQAR